MAAVLDKRLLLVSGKGGVGKSTVAAALAQASARAGYKTLICEVNAQERISRLLGKPELGPEISLVDDHLWGVNVRPEEAMREYALMTLKFKTVYKAVFENRLVKYFLRFLPSVQELVLLGKILYHLQERDSGGGFRFDRVIVDAPSTGHAVTFFSVPQVLVDTVPAGPLLAEAEKMRDLLIDPGTTAAVLVALPEEMPINETLELEQEMRTKVRITTGAVILNGHIPPRFSAEEQVAVASLGEALSAMIHGHLTRERMSAEALQRLRTGQRAPVYTLPRLYDPNFGAASIDHLSTELAALVSESA
ncbi:MAG: ArsA family ATPase [Myxococcota bacterium]|nr:ArsA family ATPase [Myxococcota bacterium]